MNFIPDSLEIQLSESIQTGERGIKYCLERCDDNDHLSSFIDYCLEKKYYFTKVNEESNSEWYIYLDKDDYDKQIKQSKLLFFAKSLDPNGNGKNLPDWVVAVGQGVIEESPCIFLYVNNTKSANGANIPDEWEGLPIIIRKIKEIKT